MVTKYRLRRIGVASNASPMRPTLSDCIELVLAQTGGLADDVLDALKRQLAQSEGEAGGDASGEAVKLAIKALLDDAQAVRATLESELRRLVFHSSSKDIAQNQSVRFEDLRFFDIREIEIHIELALARQEIIRAADDVLPMFDSLISSLLGWSTIQSALNPLKPEAFLRALLETLTAWVPVEDVRMDLLRPSAIALGVGLRELYREASEWMRSQGVQPVEPPQGHSRSGAEVRARMAQTEVERTMQTLDKLRRLLGGEPQSRAGADVQRDFTHTVPGALVALQDLKLVEPMMQRLAERSVRQLAQGKSAVVGSFTSSAEPRSKEHNQQIGQMLGEEVVSLMVDQLVNDERLLMPVRLQLRALEPALLQLARSDPRFFIDRRHSARQLLDKVVQRSLAYPADDEEAIADFTACVSDAVNGLTRSVGDAAAYAAILVGLERAWDDADEARRERREQERLAHEHVQQRLVLAQRFSDALMERFRGSNLPELVASFLRGPWSQVLAESHLLNTGAQADPRGYLALVDDLVWSVQLSLIRQDHARLVRLIPRLLARIHEGLVLIRYPREPVTLFLDELSALHDHVLDEHRRALASARAAAQAERDTALGLAAQRRARAGADTDAREAQLAERRQRAATSADADEPLPPSEQSVGAVVELLLGGAWVRAQLTWIGRNRNLFMFVSGAGLAHAMSRRTMDRLLAQERIRVVAPAFDLLIESGMAPLAAEDPQDGPAD